MANETGWVIVKTAADGALEYWNGLSFADGEKAFSKENLEAVRMCRWSDADRIFQGLHFDPKTHKVEEHMWCD